MSYSRQEAIKQLLLNNSIVSYVELEALFPDVSTMTLRRDIEKLEADGIAVKIRGGARVFSSEESKFGEAIYSSRENEYVDVKIRLARGGIQFLESGRSVFLDSGTTIMEFAKLLPDIKLNILTTGPNIALEAIKGQSHSVNMVGGTINIDNCSVSGAQALAFLKNINIDIAFMTPSGYSENSGFTCGNYAECEIKSAVIKKANRVIMLTPDYKVDKALPFTFATLKDVDILITDTKSVHFSLKGTLKNKIKIIKV